MKKVILIDDEIDMQSFIATFLRNYGVHVEAYAGGDLLHKKMNEHAYDLVITDIHMPHEDGMSIVYKTRNVWAKNNKTPIIIITGTTKADHLNVKNNDIQILKKPFLPEDLLKMVCVIFGVDPNTPEKLATDYC